MTRKLKIDWSELDTVFQSGSWEMRYYLDLETGEILMVSEEISGYVEEPPDYEVHDWMKQAIEEARRIDEKYGTRYIRIPFIESNEGYRFMERFIYTVRSGRLRDRLWRAIQGRGAFRYFNDVLDEYPAERERWFAFKGRCIHERMVGWLESQDIEPTNPIEPAPEPEEPEEEPSRDEMVEDLTLLLIYLCSWEEETSPQLEAHRPEEPVLGTVRRAWKGYLFEALDALEEQGLIRQTRRAKSLTLTEEGMLQAQELEERYASPTDG